MRIDSGIPGIGQVEISGEYTSAKVKETFEEQMRELSRILNKPPATWTEQDYLDFQKALNALGSLLKNGDNTTPGGPYYMTGDMVAISSVIIQTMQKVGFKPGLDLDPKLGLAMMKATEMSKAMLELIGKATNMKGAEKTLQEMLYSDFLLKGSEQLSGKLKELNDALKANQKILDILAAIKKLRNDCVKVAPDKIWGDKPDIKNYKDMAQYQADLQSWNARKAYEDNKQALENGTKINGKDPELKPLPPRIVMTDDQVKELLKLRDDLKAQLAELKKAGITPDQSGNLADKIQAIVDGLDKDFSQTNDPGLAAYNWMMDGQDQIGGDAGSRDKALTNGTTASQTLNDNQKDQLNQTWFVFEQFWKIAAPLMDKLSETIKKAAAAASK